MNVSSSSKCFHLWVDGCGGFLLVLGDRVRMGRGGNTLLPTAQSESLDDENEIAILADVPRHAGVICRRAEDYFWVAEQSETWIGTGDRIPISGSAQITLSIPSPLSTTAMLSLAPPHRFFGHVDQVVLVNEVLLMGPTADCHIQTSQLSGTVVLRWSGSQWEHRDSYSPGGHSQEPSHRWNDLAVGESFEIEGVSLMLESV